MVQAAVTQLERDALVALYNSTNGANWTDNTNWLDGDPCENSWFGVTCNAENSMVHGLYLPYNQLSGSIPSELGYLTNLTCLWLDSNRLTGSIPSELSNLSILQQLYLNDNQLNGSIPSELGNLSNLRYLTLNSNQLLGNIPSELLYLTNLYDGQSDFRWNALHSKDFMLIAFLNSKQDGGDWQSTQTIAPINVITGSPDITSISIDWLPITYTADAGGYEVYYSETQGGPYTYFDITSDKTFSSMVITGLYPETMYHFVVQSVTYPHSENQNTVRSEASPEVSETTLPAVPTLGTLGLLFLLAGISLFLARKRKYRCEKNTL